MYLSLELIFSISFNLSNRRISAVLSKGLLRSSYGYQAGGHH